jgi:hypothetical protein
LGYEPQWLLLKKANGAGGGWFLLDTMRGQPNGGPTAILQPDSANAEVSTTYPWPTATGFTDPGDFNNGDTVIYIAIRRGPMKTPTSATSVFAPASQIPVSGTPINAGFPVDMVFTKPRTGETGVDIIDRMRVAVLRPYNTDIEYGGNNYKFDNNVGYGDNYSPLINPGVAYGYNMFRRAPGFFDEVCFNGTGATLNQAHGLTVTPELMIFKDRASATNFGVYHKDIGPTKALYLNSTSSGLISSAFFNDTAPTASQFTVGFSGVTNGTNMVVWLFASCPGVSKVGSYLGNGSTQTINCDFAGGARFVLIKRTTSTGGWYVYDTARGMTTMTDPYLLLNSTAAESATLGSVTTVSTGFAVDANILAAINVNGASYIFFAIA